MSLATKYGVDKLKASTKSLKYSINKQDLEQNLEELHFYYQFFRYSVFLYKTLCF